MYKLVIVNILLQLFTPTEEKMILQYVEIREVATGWKFLTKQFINTWLVNKYFWKSIYLLSPFS